MESKLDIHAFKNVVAASGPNKNNTIYEGGIYNNHEWLELNLCNYQISANINPTNTISESVIFAGALYVHYGHFLLDSLARYWYIKEHPNIPIIWLVRHALPTKMHKEFFSLFNITNKMYFVDEPTLIKDIIVPDPSAITATAIRDSKFYPEYFDSLAILDGKEITHGKKIWISRKDLTKGKILNEPILEHFLKKDGWEIYTPQNHSIADQINTYATAERIAGIDGSAFHTLLFLKDLKAHIDIFPRKHTSSLLLCTAKNKGLNQQVHDVPIEYCSNVTRDSNWIWPTINPVLRALNVSKGRDLMSIQESQGSDWLNKIVYTFFVKSYLEIGIHCGENFLNVDVSDKVGVDPFFGKDYESVISDTCKFYEMKSDNFFQVFADSMLFDLIYLDGLHTFEQTLRDFCNSHRCSHEKTIWVIDDTIPSDKFSMMPTQKLAMNTRFKETGVESWAWHGDVFKVPFVINDFFPEFKFCTISDINNPKTIIWKHKKENFTPLWPHKKRTGRVDHQLIFDSMSDICNLTYEDFIKHQSGLHLKPLDQIIQLINGDFIDV